MRDFVSPIAIDLGALHTGVFFAHYPCKSYPSEYKQDFCGHIISYKDKNNLSISQESRRQKRHMLRASQRRKFAKRLLYVFFKAQGIDFFQLETKLQDFINSLFNRRGFTYFTEELDTNLIKTTNPKECNAVLEDDFFREDSNRKKIISILQDVQSWDEQKAESFLALPYFASMDRKQKEQQLKSKLYTEDKDYIRDFSSILENLSSYAYAIKRSEQDGHKHRKEYLSNIKEDIKNFKDIKSLLKKLKMDNDSFANFIGHISNLQLRALRKYFNDPKMQGESYFDMERFTKYYQKWLKSWKPHQGRDEECMKYRTHLLTLLEKKSIIEVLTRESAFKSIPPYEDQNNRRPPRCQSLLLKPESLEYHLSSWKTILAKLLKAEERRKYGNHEIGKMDEISKSVKDRTKEEKASMVLQRFLDRNIKLDPYQLRALSIDISPKKFILKNSRKMSEKRKKMLSEAAEELKEVLGSDGRDKLLQFCVDYYKDSKKARQGIWWEEQGIKRGKASSTNEKAPLLLSVCQRKPKLKKNAQQITIGNILRKSFTSVEDWESFQNFWKTTKHSGKSTIRTICKRASEYKKKYGNGFNDLITEIHSMNEKGIKITDKEEKSLSNLITKGEWASEEIGSKFFGMKKEVWQRFNNLHSLSQIYDILEGDTGGFFSTCLSCTLDNSWRSISSPNDITKANASRLPARSIRPINGHVLRILRAKAHKIAQQKISYLKGKDISKISFLTIPIIIEQNKFSFTADIAEISKSKHREKRKDASERFETKNEGKYLAKNERIRKASMETCPYEGTEIGDHSEIDHIIPRAVSREYQGSVFNSEANLIYSSTKGNLRKRDRLFGIENLHSKYLEKQFGTNMPAKVEEIIENNLQRMREEFKKENRKIFEFDKLSEAEQKYIRHSLFLGVNSDSKNWVLQLISGMGFKARVNGTQAFFAELLKNALERMIKKEYSNKINFRIEYICIPSKGINGTGNLRYRLGSTFSEYKKYQPQTTGSHVIDATIAFALALNSGQDHQEILQTLPVSKVYQGGLEWIRNLIPQDIYIHRLKRRAPYRKTSPKGIASRKIFKDTIYGTRFIPILIYKNKLRIGFDAKNNLTFVTKKIKGMHDKNALTEEEEFFEILKPLLLHEGSPITKSLREWKTKKPTSDLLHFSIDRKKAFPLLQKATHEKLKDREFQQVKILNSLRFFTKKEDVTAIILDKNNANSKVKTSKQLKDFLVSRKNFSLSPEVSRIDETGKCFKGDILYPTHIEWKDLFQKVQGCLQEKTENIEEILDKKLREYFQISSTGQRKHQKVRKIFSLPVLDCPSGGFQIARKKPNRGVVYQVQATEGYTCGFPIKDGKVDLREKSVLMMESLKRKSLAQVNSYQPEESPDEICYMDAWRSIPLEKIKKTKTEWSPILKEITSLELMPNTKNRMAIALTMPWDVFSNKVYPFVKSKNSTEKQKNGNLNTRNDVPSSIYSVYTDLGWTNDQSKNSAQIFDFLKPRSLDFCVSFLSRKVVKIEFIIESTSNSLRELYNMGHPLKS